MRKRWVPLLIWCTTALSGCSDRRAKEAAPTADAGAGFELANARSANERIDLLVRENLTAELAASPVLATWLGVHDWNGIRDYDERLDDVHLDVQARELDRMRALLDRLRAIDPAELDATHAFDRLLLEHRVSAALFTMTELRPFERNPLVYCDLVQSSIYELITDDFPAARSAAQATQQADRLHAINARLFKVRPLLEEARRNLRPTTHEILVRRAIESLAGIKGFVSETLPRAMQGVRDLKLAEELRAAGADAARALDELSAWLQRDLMPRVRGDYVLGRDRLMQLLRQREGIDATPELLVALGERELKEARRRYDDAARALGGGRPPSDVNKLLEEDHAKPEELQFSVQQTLEALLAFVRTQRLLSLPTTPPPRVMEMPPALWGYAQLQMDGPLEPRPRESYFYVDPVDKSWKDARKQQHLRQFNRPMMVRTVMHEALAHFVQNALDRQASTLMQKVALSPLMTEGWAGYVEEMLLQEGFLAGDYKTRLTVARATMLRAGRLVAAVRLHALGAKLEDVTKVFTEEVGLDDFQARRETERVQIDPMVLGDALGRIAILKLRDDWRAAHPSASLGAFHDELLRHGTPSPLLLRRLLLPDDRQGGL